MGHQKGTRGGARTGRPANKRRGFMPEPCEYDKPNENPCAPSCHPVSHERSKSCRSRRDKNKSSFNFTHTSCIMAIRNYVERMQHPKRPSHHNKGQRRTQENAEKLICSLKSDIQTISKYEEAAAAHQKKLPVSDPFFVLSAMMCKINKLESILLTQPDCKEQLAKRKEMIMMARCIKKTLLDQAQCDHQLMQDKQRKMVCLVKSLDMFEKDIRNATRGVKKLCCPKKSTTEIVACGKAPEAVKECPETPKASPVTQPTSQTPSRQCSPARSNPVLVSEPSSKKCLDAKPRPQKSQNILTSVRSSSVDIRKDSYCDSIRKFDITGLKVTYTKSHVQRGSGGEEIENVKDRLSCEVNEDEECNIEIIKDGSPRYANECNPLIKQRMNNLSKIWMESARQLIDACNSSC